MNNLIKFAPLILGACLASQSSAAVYASNGNIGFGGVLSSLEITDDGTTITATLTTGTDLNNSFVLYIDSVAGGDSNTSAYTDTADDLRRAISGFDGTNRSTVNAPAGFGIDYALGLNAGFSGLWAPVNGGSHTFVTTANAAPGGSTAGTYTMTFDFTDIGLTPGQPFNFVATYLNSGNSFRSDEAFGDGIASGNPGATAVTFSSSLTYTAIPEPSSALLGSIALLGLLRRRR